MSGSGYPKGRGDRMPTREAGRVGASDGTWVSGTVDRSVDVDASANTEGVSGAAIGRISALARPRAGGGGGGDGGERASASEPVGSGGDDAGAESCTCNVITSVN